MYPVADVVPVARTAGARIVIVNGGETAMDHLADVVLRGSISEILPASRHPDPGLRRGASVPRRAPRADRYRSVTGSALVTDGICASGHPM